MKAAIIISAIFGFIFLLDSLKYYPEYPIDWLLFVIGGLFFLLSFILYADSIDESTEDMEQ